MSSTTVASARRVLERFAADRSIKSTAAPASPPSPDSSAQPASPVLAVSPAEAQERVAWADALIAIGHLDAATGQLVAAVREDAWWPETMLATVRRLTGEHARALMSVAVDEGRVSVSSSVGRPRPSLAGAVAHLAAGSDEAEEALLRAVLVIREYEDFPHAMVRLGRAFRIAEVLAALAEAHPGEPERLDRWSQILGESDRRRLAAAAGLLAPLGLAEIDRRCGETDRDLAVTEAVPLVPALAAAGRTAEALELAARLDPNDRQVALVALAGVVTAETERRAVLAAFRACPKGGRDRDQQMVHRHRLARVLLTFDRFDDALAELTRLRDCRIHRFGPAELVRELLHWLDQRPEEVTGERLLALLDVLEAPVVITQEVDANVTHVLHRMLVLADPAMRAEILGPRATALRARTRTGNAALVDVGLAAGLLTLGRTDEAMAALRGAVSMTSRGRRLSHIAQPLIAAAVETALPDREPDLFAEVFGTVTALGFGWPPESHTLAVRLGPAGRATAARLVDRFTGDHPHRWAAWLAEAAEQTADFGTLHILLENTTDERTASTIGRRLAMALARHGDPADAEAMADLFGLRLPA